MNIHTLHEWSVTPQEAIAIQNSLRERLIYDTPLDMEAISLVGGVDVSVKPDADGIPISRAAVVVLTFPELKVIEVARAEMPTPFPYIPGLLTFREGPVLVKAFEALQQEPDAFIFDGMGRAHPRRMGIAAHMGLWLEKPTVGCGKTYLIGKFDAVPVEAGGYSTLTDRGETIGVVLRTRTNVKPVFISVGHRANLNAAVELTLRCTTKYRLPEPIRAAHNAAGQSSTEG